MVYTILKFLLRLSAEFFFGKHHIKNLEKLNNGKPLVVCANHTTAHLDGVLIMIFSKRKFHVLVRGDIFKKKWVAKLLGTINLIPIFRMRDGFSSLEKNTETFDICYDILKRNEAIIIFPEANCETERKLRKLHKGAAKIAMMAEERSGFTLGVEMATVGITMQNMVSSGGRIFLEASEPFSLNPYFSRYKDNPNKALHDITNDVESDLRSVLPVVEETNDEYIFEEIVTRKENIDDLSVWKKTAKLINSSDKELKSALTSALIDFKKHLKKHGISHSTIENLQVKSRIKRWLNLLIHLIDIIAIFPFFLIGFLFNHIPYTFPKRLSNKLFKDKCFVLGTHFAMTTFLYVIFYIVYIIVLSMYVNILSVSIAIFVIMVCGLVSHYYSKRARNLYSALRYEFAGDKKRREWRAQSRIISSEIAEWVKY